MAARVPVLMAALAALLAAPGSARGVEPCWLARHQQADGSWTVPGDDGRARADAASTGLAVLAFLGAGYTQRDGRYKENVKRSLAWIAKRQDEEGFIRSGTEPAGAEVPGLAHLVCSLAISEAYAMTRDQALRESAQKALDFSLQIWAPAGGRARTARSGPPDPTLTGWLVMQVRSGQISGLKVDDAALGRVRKLVEALDAAGAEDAEGKSRPPVLMAAAVSMFCRRMLGMPVSVPEVQRAAERLAKVPPVWIEPRPGQRRDAGQASELSEKERKDLARMIRELGDDDWNVRDGASRALVAQGIRVRPLVKAAVASADPEVSDRAQQIVRQFPPDGIGQESLYQYWYFGTMAMFMQGGESWRGWSAALRETLAENQHKGGPLDGTAQDLDGSWEPLDAADSAGRVWTTALAALSFEVYYRYLPVLNGK